VGVDRACWSGTRLRAGIVRPDKCSKQLICAGKVSGTRPTRRSQVHRHGARPCSLSRANLQHLLVDSSRTANNSPGRRRWRTILAERHCLLVCRADEDGGRTTSAQLTHLRVDAGRPDRCLFPSAQGAQSGAQSTLLKGSVAVFSMSSAARKATRWSSAAPGVPRFLPRSCGVNSTRGGLTNPVGPRFVAISTVGMPASSRPAADQST